MGRAVFSSDRLMRDGVYGVRVALKKKKRTKEKKDRLKLLVYW